MTTAKMPARADRPATIQPIGPVAMVVAAPTAPICTAMADSIGATNPHALNPIAPHVRVTMSCDSTSTGIASIVSATPVRTARPIVPSGARASRMCMIDEASAPRASVTFGSIDRA